MGMPLNGYRVDPQWLCCYGCWVAAKLNGWADTAKLQLHTAPMCIGVVATMGCCYGAWWANESNG